MFWADCGREYSKDILGSHIITHVDHAGNGICSVFEVVHSRSSCFALSSQGPTDMYVHSSCKKYNNDDIISLTAFDGTFILMISSGVQKDPFVLALLSDDPQRSAMPCYPL